MHNSIKIAAAALALSLAPLSARALDVNITQDIATVGASVDGETVSIQRIQDQENILADGFAKTSRKCPPFCIQPMQVAPGVTTVGELELLDFIKNKVNTGKGVLIDARTPDWQAQGTIPGSVNIPFTSFDKSKSVDELKDALRMIGVVKKVGASFIRDTWDKIRYSVVGNPNAADSPWDFTNAKDIMLWCNGMWCGQSPTAIHNLLALGYPAERIYYYRDGMQGWKILGLTVIKPK
jgi:rhodanese-related sulfurtransferase